MSVSCLLFRPFGKTELCIISIFKLLINHKDPHLLVSDEFIILGGGWGGGGMHGFVEKQYGFVIITWK